MWIWDSLSSRSFGCRFAIRYPIRFCCRRGLDSIVSWVLNIFSSPFGEDALNPIPLPNKLPLVAPVGEPFFTWRGTHLQDFKAAPKLKTLFETPCDFLLTQWGKKKSNIDIPSWLMHFTSFFPLASKENPSEISNKVKLQNSVRS